MAHLIFTVLSSGAIFHLRYGSYRTLSGLVSDAIHDILLRVFASYGPTSL